MEFTCYLSFLGIWKTYLQKDIRFLQRCMDYEIVWNVICQVIGITQSFFQNWRKRKIIIWSPDFLTKWRAKKQKLFYILKTDEVFSVQSLSRVQLFATPWMAASQASLSITNSWSLLKLISIESVMPSNHLILCHPLLLLPATFPSIRVFSIKSVLLIRWPKYWSFSFSISPSNEHPGLISFRMDWLDLLEIQGTLKSLLKHHRSKVSILTCSAIFIVQQSHPYMTTEKNHTFD